MQRVTFNHLRHLTPTRPYTSLNCVTMTYHTTTLTNRRASLTSSPRDWPVIRREREQMTLCFSDAAGPAGAPVRDHVTCRGRSPSLNSMKLFSCVTRQVDTPCRRRRREQWPLSRAGRRVEGFHLKSTSDRRHARPAANPAGSTAHTRRVPLSI